MTKHRVTLSKSTLIYKPKSLERDHTATMRIAFCVCPNGISCEKFSLRDNLNTLNSPNNRVNIVPTISRSHKGSAYIENNRLISALDTSIFKNTRNLIYSTMMGVQIYMKGIGMQSKIATDGSADIHVGMQSKLALDLIRNVCTKQDPSQAREMLL